MRILHTADWHLGKRLSFYSRIEEQREVLERNSNHSCCSRGRYGDSSRRFI